MNLASQFAIPKEVMSRQVGDELVILDLASGIYFGLDAVGTRIWQLLEEGKPLADICEAMTSEYEVSASQMQEDLLRLIAELQARGLVREAD